ncbi:MAG: hypothetical protein H6708_21375 [Kofleriaceae bacterium]|nr:hypothetical protein [Myxococcales bacterium]MCB9562964.1 hypothetical protein [Kofleriaceae bacterium]
MFAIEPHGVAIARLETAGLIRPVSDGFRTTRRWQGLVARVAAGMVRDAETWVDPRVPVAQALVEVYGVDPSDDELVELIEVMVPIHLADLS